jgi:hypothetical protein
MNENVEERERGGGMKTWGNESVEERERGGKRTWEKRTWRNENVEE